jgi:CRISPR system Cascade subunit CasE
MTTLHMLSLAVDLAALRRQGAIRGFAEDEGRTLHHLLAETFGKGIAQPFRLMPGANGARHATLYAYATSASDELKQTASETAPPEAGMVFDLGQLATKQMPASFSAGRRLSFDVRVRPVRRLMKPLEGMSREHARRSGGATKGDEVDAFVVARLRTSLDDPHGGGDDAASRETVYRAWLAERLAGAAKIDQGATRLVDHARVIVRRGHTRVEGPSATFHGALTVLDPARFAGQLARGVGRHTAYGYGMLLLRPARE